MTRNHRLPQVLVSAAFLAVCVTAVYDASFCTDQLSRWNENYADSKITPYFLPDYSFLSETTFQEVENKAEVTLSHQKLFYISHHKKVVLDERTPNGTFWGFADQRSNDCIYKKGSLPCVAEEGDCRVTAKAVGFGNQNGHRIEVGSSSARMGFPQHFKKQVSYGSSTARGIDATKLGFCWYRESTDESVVSIVYARNQMSYTALDSTQNIMLVLNEYSKKPGSDDVSFKRTDFTDLKALPPSDINTEFGLGETRCGTVKSKFTEKYLPKTSPRFSYTNQEFISNTSSTAFRILTSFHEDNLKSQINTLLADHVVKNQSEKDTVFRADDFNGKVMYKFSWTRGECRVRALAPTASQQPTSEDIWHLNAPNPTYLGVYSNRDIPCHVWHFDRPSHNPRFTSITLYVATKPWLSKNKLPLDLFYPVEKIIWSAQNTIFQEIYSFKEHPEFNIPILGPCFQEDDIVTAQMVLTGDFIENNSEHFQVTEEIRKMVMKISGIKSPIRIGNFYLAPSQTAPKEETVIGFKIYGRFVGHPDPSDDVYKADPVTSQQAAELINKQVDTGRLNITMKGKQISFNFKKGSFQTSKSGARFTYWDSLGQGTSGYSSGAMAGAAIGLLLACILLGLAAVFGYKWWTEGMGGNTTIGMKNLQEEN